MEIDQENENSVLNRTTQQRKLHYRELLNRLEDIEETDDLSNLRTINELGSILKSANDINNECDITERVANAEETLLDANVLSAAGSLLVKCLETTDVSTCPYNADDFSEKLKESIQGNETVDLLKLMDTARDVISEQPTCSFLYGTYNFTKLPVPKARKQYKKEAREVVATKYLQNVSTTEKTEESIVQKISFFTKVLQEEYRKNNNCPLNYYDFVVDSDSFTSTVENVFYCLFLLHEGKAKFNLDESNRVMITPIGKSDLKHFRHSNGVNTQIITSITMEDWQKLQGREGVIQRHKK